MIVNMKPIAIILAVFVAVAQTATAASVILARTPTGDATEDKRIVLQNSNFGRQWTATLGTNWTKVRVALRVIMNNTGANLTSSPKFFVGMCKSTNNLFLDATSSNCYGAFTTSATWTHNAGPPTYYGTLTLVPAVRVGVNQTNGGNLTTAFRFKSDATTTNRVMLFVDVVKPAGASTNFTVTVFYPNGTTALDTPLTDFLLQAPLASPSFTGHATSSTIGCPLDENNGYLDTATVAWDRSTPTIEVCDIAVVKLQ